MSWTEADEERLNSILESFDPFEEEDLPPHLMPLPPSPLPDIEDTDESINSIVKELRSNIQKRLLSPRIIKEKLLDIISNLKRFPPRPKVSQAIQEIRDIIEDMAKSIRLHRKPTPYIKLKNQKPNLTHQVSKPGNRWSVSKGSTRKSRRSHKSRRSRKSRKSRKSRRATRRATRRVAHRI
jgi:hypothetical protein